VLAGIGELRESNAAAAKATTDRSDQPWPVDQVGFQTEQRN
jgi:hypothetical protein